MLAVSVTGDFPDTARLHDRRSLPAASDFAAIPAPDGRFDALDGIRGIAAFMVVLHHYTQYSPVPTLNGSSGVVDLFFMLSGFVLMCSYARKIAGGMSLGAFAMARLSRLAPMYLVGLGLGLLAALIHLAAVLSISIGLLNLFPVPLLDGGHLLFYSVEAVRGRPLSIRAQEMGFRIGLALVLMLMVFATYNDILHLAAS